MPHVGGRLDVVPVEIDPLVGEAQLAAQRERIAEHRRRLRAKEAGRRQHREWPADGLRADARELEVVDARRETVDERHVPPLPGLDLQRHGALPGDKALCLPQLKRDRERRRLGPEVGDDRRERGAGGMHAALVGILDLDAVPLVAGQMRDGPHVVDPHLDGLVAGRLGVERKIERIGGLEQERPRFLRVARGNRRARNRHFSPALPVDRDRLGPEEVVSSQPDARGARVDEPGLQGHRMGAAVHHQFNPVELAGQGRVQEHRVVGLTGHDVERERTLAAVGATVDDGRPRCGHRAGRVAAVGLAVFEVVYDCRLPGKLPRLPARDAGAGHARIGERRVDVKRSAHGLASEFLERHLDRCELPRLGWQVERLRPHGLTLGVAGGETEPAAWEVDAPSVAKADDHHCIFRQGDVGAIRAEFEREPAIFGRLRLHREVVEPYLPRLTGLHSLSHRRADRDCEDLHRRIDVGGGALAAAGLQPRAEDGHSEPPPALEVERADFRLGEVCIPLPGGQREVDVVLERHQQFVGRVVALDPDGERRRLARQHLLRPDVGRLAALIADAERLPAGVLFCRVVADPRIVPLLEVLEMPGVVELQRAVALRLAVGGEPVAALAPLETAQRNLRARLRKPLLRAERQAVHLAVDIDLGQVGAHARRDVGREVDAVHAAISGRRQAKLTLERDRIVAVADRQGHRDVTRLGRPVARQRDDEGHAAIGPNALAHDRIPRHARRLAHDRRPRGIVETRDGIAERDFQPMGLLRVFDRVERDGGLPRAVDPGEFHLAAGERLVLRIEQRPGHRRRHGQLGRQIADDHPRLRFAILPYDGEVDPVGGCGCGSSPNDRSSQQTAEEHGSGEHGECEAAGPLEHDHGLASTAAFSTGARTVYEPPKRCQAEFIWNAGCPLSAGRSMKASRPR